MAVILVIGASRGIGLELVREYAQAGWTVLATVRDTEAQARLQALGAQAFLVDVLQPESVTALATALAGQQIDVAMYVAGVIRRPNAREVPTQADFDAVMHTNVLGAMQLLPQIGPIVEASGGVFAFIVDVADRRCGRQLLLAVPRQQDGAEYGGGLGPA